jgi:L-lactate utilization protein LutB
MNEYLEERGITALETDLAELIVQLDHDFGTKHSNAPTSTRHSR